MLTLLRSFNKFGSLNAQLLLNKSKNAVRFESQNVLWDHEEANYQTLALAKGLTSLSIGKNDTVLLRVPPSQQTEAYIAKLATAGIDAHLLLSRAATPEEADAEIKNNNVKAILFEPTLPIGTETYIELLNRLMPELASTPNGARLRSKRYGSLSALIQTNFYSYPAVYKFRSVLNYAQDKYFKIAFDAQPHPLPLPDSHNPVFVTSPAHDFAFRAGLLNSTINGRFVVVVEPRDVNRIAEYHNNQVDLVATEDIANLNPAVNVFVAKGSDILKSHPKRTQL